MTVQPALRDQCIAAANQLEFAVPCPTVLPAADEPHECERPGNFPRSSWKGNCVLGDGFFLKISVLPEVPHFLVTAGGASFDDCRDHDAGTVELDSGQAIVYRCPEWAGLHADHVLMQWEVEGVWYAVSSHMNPGHTRYQEQLVKAVAQGIDLVAPEEDHALPDTS